MFLDKVLEVDDAGLLHLRGDFLAIDDLEETRQVPRRRVQALEHRLSRLPLGRIRAHGRRQGRMQRPWLHPCSPVSYVSNYLR